MSAARNTPDMWHLVCDAESAMNRVYDHAYLLYDHLSGGSQMTLDEQHALVWPAGDLVQAGRELREHCEKLGDAALALKKSPPPAPAADGQFLDLGDMDMRDLFGVHRALMTITEVAEGLGCQPKFHQSDRDETPGGVQIGRLIDFFYELVEHVREEAEARAPKSQNDRDLKLYFLAQAAADGSGSPEHMLRVFTEAVAKVGEVVS